AGTWGLQRRRAGLGRGRLEGARLPLLPRVRLAGLLPRTDGAGPGRRLGRVVRRPVVPASDGVVVRLSPPPVGWAPGLDPASWPRRLGLSPTSLRRRQVRRSGGQGPRTDRGPSRRPAALL